MILTKWQFRRRFTLEEKMAITSAAKTDVLVQVFLDDLQSAGEVDTSLPDGAIAGLDYLTAAGILAAGRKEQILTPDNPLPAAERPVVSLHEVSGGFGYSLDLLGSKIRQDYAPALDGNRVMTRAEAEGLANYVADKIHAGLSRSVSREQVLALWSGTKTARQLIDEELSGL